MTRSLLLSCEAVGKAYGTRSLFEGLSFGLFEGDHVGLVGLNGSGKSTLLKILAGIEPSDIGGRSVRGGVRVAFVAQDPVLPDHGTRPTVPLASPWHSAAPVFPTGAPQCTRCPVAGGSAWPSPARSWPSPTSS